MNDPRVTELRSLLPQAMVPDWVRLGARAVRLFKDRLHPDKHDPILNRLLEQARASVALRERRRISVPRVAYPADLPITARKDDIVAAIRANQVVVLAGETGSGKTTQIPKMCLEAGLGIEAKIGCTQPRRVAALSISKRIAEELGVGWGREVGCKIRFDDRSSSETFIKLMTDGILLAETQGDPDLSEYNAIIIDEAHERSLNIDFLLGYLKGLLARRTDLKLIVTSATIDTQAFSKHFGNAPIIEVSGRMFPVDVVYTPFEHEPDSEEEAEGRAGILPARPVGVSSDPSCINTSLPGEDARPTALHASPETPRLAASIRASLRAGSSDGDTLTYADAAVRAADTILYDTDAGDLLIFMPGERDIREISDQLEGRFGGAVEIVPLFGRLSSGDQQRVFSPTTRRKVVIATNIAETSLTIPGIRYVIDAGLARISRYNPRTRTKRLPVEPVSQSSANQRKGRAGRVQDGVCIRLYSQDDFKARPPFTQPEIQRANLAEVILRMKAFQLGDIETFPFVQPPAPNAIANGYALLQELGALDAERAVTPLGWDLARLPIDPTLGRMLIESGREGVSRELLIIASGLSIQDPRERPLDQKDAAAAAHRRFTDPQSDFLTLLNVWNAVHDQWESLRTQGARRKFCKQHFLSYLRMREWQDLHGQLEDALEDIVGRDTGRAKAPAEPPRGEPRTNRALMGNPPPSDIAAGTVSNGGSLKAARREPSPYHPKTEHPLYIPIHRSILSGLLGHVSRREERNSYKGSGNRLLTLFPGSALFERGEPQRRFNPDRKGPAPSPKEKTNQPLWIVAGEIVETSQLFARTLAGIDPQWIAELAPHLCKRTHMNPHWSAAAGRVLCDEVLTLHGMEITRRKVSYGNIDAKEATKIFIRAALVEDGLLPPRSHRDDEADDDTASEDVRLLTSAATNQYPFLAHNRTIRQKIESWQTRVRRYDIGDLDELLCEFYGKRLENVSSRDELNRWLREPANGESLKATQKDFVGDQPINFDSDAFPDTVSFDDRAVSLLYAYAPGEEWDGVTLRLPADLAKSLTSAEIEWAVPGLRAEQAEEMLRSLPKAIRRELMPMQEKVAEIIRDFRPTGESLRNDLGRFIHQRYGVAVPASAWSEAAIPAHLRPRVEVVARDGRKLASGRNFDELRTQLEDVKDIPAAEPPIWRKARQQWEKPAVTGWTFGDLPERVLVGEHRGQTIHAWPGLDCEDGGVVSVRLFRSVEEAGNASIDGTRALVERALHKEFAWLRKDLKALEKTGWGGSEDLQDSALELLKRTAFPKQPLPSMTQAAFDGAVLRTREQMRLLLPKVVEQLGAILLLRQKIEKGWEVAAPVPAQKPRTLSDLSQLGQPFKPVAKPGAKPTSVFAAELAALLPPRFPEQLTVERLPHLQRYLKALQIRCERASQKPLKEQERVRIVAPYAAALAAFTAKPPKTAEGRKAVDDFRWMVEELRVSVFAQEVGTAFPVSPKRLDEELEKIRRLA